MTPPPETPPGPALYVGKHRIFLEPPDTFFVVVDGDVTASDVLRFHELIAAFEEDKAYILMLMDISRLGSMGSDARRAGSRPEATQRLRGVGMYGASFTQRVLIMLVVKAFSMLKGGDSLLVVNFETEAQARAWIAERRKALDSSSSTSGA